MTHYYRFCKRSEHLKNVLKLIDFEGNRGRDPVSEINTLTWRCHVVVRTLATLDAGPWASRSVCASSHPLRPRRTLVRGCLSPRQPPPLPCRPAQATDPPERSVIVARTLLSFNYIVVKILIVEKEWLILFI